MPQGHLFFETLWRGKIPEAINSPAHALPEYFSSYVQTHIERNIYNIVRLQDRAYFA